MAGTYDSIVGMAMTTASTGSGISYIHGTGSGTTTGIDPSKHFVPSGTWVTGADTVSTQIEDRTTKQVVETILARMASNMTEECGVGVKLWLRHTGETIKLLFERDDHAFPGLVLVKDLSAFPTDEELYFSILMDLVEFGIVGLLEKVGIENPMK